MEEVHRLKNKIKDQELQEDLRHNYVYQILFENWKKKHKALAPYGRKEMKLPDLEDDDRTRRDEWLEFDEEKIKFPSPEEIDKMNIKDDFFDVDKFHELNVKRLDKLGKPKKEEDKRFKFDIDQLDDKLFGRLDEEKEKASNNQFEVRQMYSTKDNKSYTQRDNHRENPRDSYNDKKIYADTLK